MKKILLAPQITKCPIYKPQKLENWLQLEFFFYLSQNSYVDKYLISNTFSNYFLWSFILLSVSVYKEL
ncbi:hypothetical protein XENTR_v10013549 [Xenopus tropicalis]|nr:hypothetical protein XENTR_v10013549 [Xenopus tropicalis]